jgi:hypothetical protein
MLCERQQPPLVLPLAPLHVSHVAFAHVHVFDPQWRKSARANEIASAAESRCIAFGGIHDTCARADASMQFDAGANACERATLARCAALQNGGRQGNMPQSVLTRMQIHSGGECCGLL